MLAQYLRKHDPPLTQWRRINPGVESCRVRLGEKDAPMVFTPAKAPRHYEIFFCQSGTLTLRRRDGHLRTIRAGEILLLSDITKIDRMEMPGPLTGILIAVDAARAEESLKRLCLAMGGITIDVTEMAHFMNARDGYVRIEENLWSRALFQTLDEIAPEDQPTYCIWKTMELLYLLSHRHNLYTQVVAVQPADGPLGRIVSEAAAYMAGHLDEKLTIAGLSQRFGISQTTLKNEFRRLYGKPVRTWLQEARMKRAAVLLTCTTLSVLEVAQEVGYESTSQFTAIFQRYYGTSPGQFRKKMSKPASI